LTPMTYAVGSQARQETYLLLDSVDPMGEKKNTL